MVWLVIVAGWVFPQVWTQEKVDEAMSLYEQTLKDIKNGAKISKSVDDDESIGYVLNPTAAKILSEYK